MLSRFMSYPRSRRSRRMVGVATGGGEGSSVPPVGGKRSAQNSRSPSRSPVTVGAEMDQRGDDLARRRRAISQTQENVRAVTQMQENLRAVTQMQENLRAVTQMQENLRAVTQ